MLGRPGGLTYVTATADDMGWAYMVYETEGARTIPLPPKCHQDVYALRISMKVPFEIALGKASPSLEALPPGVLGMVTPYIGTALPGYRVYNEFKAEAPWDWRPGRHVENAAIDWRNLSTIEYLYRMETRGKEAWHMSRISCGESRVRQVAEENEVRRWCGRDAMDAPLDTAAVYRQTVRGHREACVDLRWALVALQMGYLDTHHTFNKEWFRAQLKKSIEKLRTLELTPEHWHCGVLLSGAINELDDIRASLSSELARFVRLGYLEVCPAAAK
jgi:hypothetical protein